MTGNRRFSKYFTIIGVDKDIIISHITWTNIMQFVKIRARENAYDGD
jgi:hypothetical protein